MKEPLLFVGCEGVGTVVFTNRVGEGDVSPGGIGYGEEAGLESIRFRPGLNTVFEDSVYFFTWLVWQRGVLQWVLHGVWWQQLTCWLQLAFGLQQGTFGWQLAGQFALQFVRQFTLQLPLHSLQVQSVHLQSLQVPLHSLQVQSAHFFSLHSFWQHSVFALGQAGVCAIAGKAIIEAAAIHAKISNFFIERMSFNEFTVQI